MSQRKRSDSRKSASFEAMHLDFMFFFLAAHKWFDMTAYSHIDTGWEHYRKGNIGVFLQFSDIRKREQKKKQDEFCCE